MLRRHLEELLASETAMQVLGLVLVLMLALVLVLGLGSVLVLGLALV